MDLTITHRNYNVVIEEDGKPLRTDQKPRDVAQGQWVKLRIFDSTGKFLATADRFGYTVEGTVHKALATPFTNMQRFIESLENPTKATSA